MSLSAAYELFDAGIVESHDWFIKETATLRSGRVKPDTVSGIVVDYYGTRTPLNGVASVTSSDARTLVITPWDHNAIVSIEKAITQANIGVSPTVDGHLIRLSFPSLTEELRNTTIKQLHNKAEEARVRLRQIRDEAMKMLKEDKQNGDITEDDFYKGREKLDELIKKADTDLDTVITRKEEDIKSI